MSPLKVSSKPMAFTVVSKNSHRKWSIPSQSPFHQQLFNYTITRTSSTRLPECVQFVYLGLWSHREGFEDGNPFCRICRLLECYRSSFLCRFTASMVSCELRLVICITSSSNQDMVGSYLHIGWKILQQQAAGRVWRGIICVVRR